jgi:hypothetical protein
MMAQLRLTFDEALVEGAALHDWMQMQGMAPPLPRADAEGWADVIQQVLRRARAVDLARDEAGPVDSGAVDSGSGARLGDAA